MKVRKMPFEKNSFMLSSGGNGLTTLEWNNVAEWLQERNMNFDMQGGILTLYREVDCTMFILKWCSDDC